MPSTATIQATINWAKPFLEQQPLLINGMEPALGSANLILQTMLGPPFSWAWNRGVLTFTSGNQDSQQLVSGFGFLEEGTVQPSSGGKPWAIGVRQSLSVDQSAARPQWCAPYIDDGAGNVTFRLMPSPDQSYLVTLPYQRSAPHLMSLGTTWSPVPDDLVYICQWGFLALMSLIGNDARFNEYNTKFTTTLLSAQGGLTDMERNLFLGNWLRVTSQVQGNQLATSERFRAREM